MKLQNLGVQELDKNELLSVDGGGWFTDLVVEVVVANAKFYAAVADSFEDGSDAVINAHNNMYH